MKTDVNNMHNLALEEVNAGVWIVMIESSPNNLTAEHLKYLSRGGAFTLMFSVKANSKNEAVSIVKNFANIKFNASGSVYSVMRMTPDDLPNTYNYVDSDKITIN
jgi:hypothetical protein